MESVELYQAHGAAPTAAKWTKCILLFDPEIGQLLEYPNVGLKPLIILSKLFVLIVLFYISDVQVWQFMRHVTDLSKTQIYKVFDMLDVNGSGSIDFDEFYFLVCILISIKVKILVNIQCIIYKYCK